MRLQPKNELRNYPSTPTKQRCSLPSPQRLYALWFGLTFCSFLVCCRPAVLAQESVAEPSESKESTSSEVPEKRPPTQTKLNKDFSTPPKVTRYALFLLKSYDLNRDGSLQIQEWKSMHGHPELIDINEDGIITLDELTRWIVKYGRRKQIGHVSDGETSSDPPPAAKSNAQSDIGEDNLSVETDPTESAAGERQRDQKFFVPSKRLPAGLPEWFLSHDMDGDSQLTFSEFSPTGGAAELADFESYDANGDGIVTAKEYVNKGNDKSSATSKPTKESNSSDSAQSSKKQPRKKSKKAPQSN